MANPRLSGIHQTILVVAVTAAAVIGSVAGAVGAVIMTGAINASDLFGRLSVGDDMPGVDRHIVELIEEESATISVVDNVAPSVVSVIIRRPRAAFYAEDDEAYFFDPFYLPPELTEEEANELVEVGGGTGFFMSDDGYVVTNNHVVTGAGTLDVWVGGDQSTTYGATVLGASECLDLAVIKADGSGFPFMGW